MNYHARRSIALSCARLSARQLARSALLCALTWGVLLGQPALADEAKAPVELTQPTGVSAGDFPYDDGSVIAVYWDRMPYDAVEGVEYRIERAATADGPFTEVMRVPAGKHFMKDVALPFWAWSKNPDRHLVQVPTPTRPAEADVPAPAADPAAADDEAAPQEEEGKPDVGTTYYFRVQPVYGEQSGPASEVVSAAARSNWLALPRLNNFVCVVVFGGILLAYLEYAKRRELFLRKIPGLVAVDEAIGRATEMGRPVLYMTGRLDMDNISTIAATIILGEVAKKTARFEVDLKVPHSYSVTMAVCREITRNAYLEAGRPDIYRDDINYYITEEQFSYAAAVNGQMLREKPGAVFYMGYYYAESLLMAEAGATTGAIQIAGTDSESQLPFFVTTCDYTLIGEELFAASAYLSRRPELVGTLRGQDLGKLIIMIGLLVGTAIVTLAPLGGYSTDWLYDILRSS